MNHTLVTIYVATAVILLTVAVVCAALVGVALALDWTARRVLLSAEAWREFVAFMYQRRQARKGGDRG